MRGLDEKSQIIIWVRAVATAMLAGVLAQLVLSTTGRARADPGRRARRRGRDRLRGVPDRAALGVRRRRWPARLAVIAGRVLVRRPEPQAFSAAASFERVVGQHLGLFLLARRRLHRDAGLARDDVDVQVEHHLAAGALVELLDGDAVGAEHLHRGLGDLLRDLRDRGEVVGLDVEQVAGRRLRQHQRVARRARHDVEEGQHLVVLVDLVARQFAAQDFGEDVVADRSSAWGLQCASWRDQSCSCSAKSLRNGAAAASSSPAAST